MIAGSWLIASVLTDLMIVMSSTIVEMCGNSSLTHEPQCPCCANLKTDGAQGNRAWPEVIVVMRLPLRMLSGRSLSKNSASFGL